MIAAPLTKKYGKPRGGKWAIRASKKQSRALQGLARPKLCPQCLMFTRQRRVDKLRRCLSCGHVFQPTQKAKPQRTFLDRLLSQLRPKAGQS